MSILESSFLIDILRARPEAVKLLDKIEANEHTLYIAAPTVMELWLGALESNTKEEEKNKIEELLASFIVLPLDSNSAKRAAEIESDLIRNGKIIETEDIMIAGIALSNGKTLVTRDEHFTRIPGLRVLKY